MLVFHLHESLTFDVAPLHSADQGKTLSAQVVRAVDCFFPVPSAGGGSNTTRALIFLFPGRGEAPAAHLKPSSHFFLMGDCLARAFAISPDAAKSDRDL